MRHGEATDNVKELISDKEIYWSILTEKGKQTVVDSVKDLPDKIDKIYVSPFPRTVETAHYVYEKYSNAEVVIENRLHEIYYGEYSGQENNEELDRTRMRQIDGDYFVRFGEYGENKFDIESRLCDFLNDVYNNNFQANTILIVSHGSITSYIKRILDIKTSHIKTGKIEEFVDVNFSPLFERQKLLKRIKTKCIRERLQAIESLEVNDNLKRNLMKMVKNFNNIAFSESYFSNFIDGIKTDNLIQIKAIKFDNSPILICFYNDFEVFAKKWMEHYISIGIKNFVLVDNNSTDSSTKILKTYANKVNISFWKIDEQYNCDKMCGWKQQILEYYGAGRQYLIVDSDELFIYKNYQFVSLVEFLKEEKLSFIKSLMLDVYTDKNIFEGELVDFKFVDRATYRKTNKVPYGERFYGGPRFRIFGTTHSLQKISFISYTGKEVVANNHFYYPWSINKKAKYCSYLLHYKFLLGDRETYNKFVEDEGHGNNSREYKFFRKRLLKNEKICFYNEDISIPIDKINFYQLLEK